jgi:hypothetical protein
MRQGYLSSSRIDMAEEKKDSFPWIQLIATVGTIIAALIGITPYILKLNTPAPQTPTIVILTLPPAVTTQAAVTTTPPATTVETTPVATQTTVVATTVPTTGPPPTETPAANVTANQTAPTTVPTTPPATTTIPTTAPPTTQYVPPLSITLNQSTLVRGSLLFASGTTDPSVPQVSISVNSTTFQSGEVLTDVLAGGTFEFAVNTSEFAPGDFTIWAIVPGTPAVASAPFVITAA